MTAAHHSPVPGATAHSSCPGDGLPPTPPGFMVLLESLPMGSAALVCLCYSGKYNDTVLPVCALPETHLLRMGEGGKQDLFCLLLLVCTQAQALLLCLHTNCSWGMQSNDCSMLPHDGKRQHTSQWDRRRSKKHCAAGGGAADQIWLQVQWPDSSCKDCLVPYASLMNHSIHPHIVRYSRLDSELHQLQFRLFRPLAEGQQCFLSYGPLSNLKLLLFYGMAIDQNPYDAVAIDLRVGSMSRATFPAAELPCVELQCLDADYTPTHPLLDLHYACYLCVSANQAKMQNLNGLCALRCALLLHVPSDFVACLAMTAVQLNTCCLVHHLHYSSCSQSALQLMLTDSPAGRGKAVASCSSQQVWAPP